MKVTELSSNKAATIFSSVKITREHPTRALTNVDLENHISQAVWKFFDRCRGEAALRLGVGEMDLTLSDVRVLGVKIDGHQVINPSGFTGRELEIILSLTVVEKGVVSGDSFTVEGGSTRAYILSHLLNLGKAFYIESDSERTNIFSINGSEVGYFSGFDWGGTNVISALQEVLDIGADVLERIYQKYTQGDISDRFGKKLDKVFYRVFGEFVNGALMNVKNAGGLRTQSAPKIYYNPLFSVPEGVYRRYFSFGRRKLKFLKPDKNLDIDDFMDENIHGVYEDLNELAKRRITWLMPSAGVSETEDKKI